MITKIEARNYRSLRSVSQSLDRFQLLVGPNGSGKSTFLDVPALLKDMIEDGVGGALLRRAATVSDLMWNKQGSRFAIAVEARRGSDNVEDATGKTIRYAVEIAFLPDSNEIVRLGEELWFKEPQEGSFGPGFGPSPSLPQRPDVQWKRRLIGQPTPGSIDMITAEGEYSQMLFHLPTASGTPKLALSYVPEDHLLFPTALWFKRQILDGVRPVALDIAALSDPSAPGVGREIRSDGSGLPWAIESLRSNPAQFEQWLNHLRTGVPEIENVTTVEQAHDKHRYVQVKYRDGLELPSWLISEGTLRLIALTLIGYLDEPDRTYLIEEPENGIHPRAIETVFQALSVTYEAQILCASHAPSIVACAEPHQLLCFSRDDEGATHIVPGNEHPILKEWRRKTDLGSVFAAGVLG